MRTPISGIYKIKGIGDVLARRVEQATVKPHIFSSPRENDSHVVWAQLVQNKLSNTCQVRNLRY